MNLKINVCAPFSAYCHSCLRLWWCLKGGKGGSSGGGVVLFEVVVVMVWLKVGRGGVG